MADYRDSWDIRQAPQGRHGRDCADCVYVQCEAAAHDIAPAFVKPAAVVVGRPGCADLWLCHEHVVAPARPR